MARTSRSHRDPESIITTRFEDGCTRTDPGTTPRIPRRCPHGSEWRDAVETVTPRTLREQGGLGA